MKPIKYRVLLADQMSKSDRTEVAALVTTLYTGPEAKEKSCRLIAPGEWVNQNWQYEILDMRGRVGVLKYKGVEAAVFFQRQIGEVEPLPCDPVPEGVIKDPADAWVRLDLLGLSARQSGGRVGKQKKSAEEMLLLVQKELTVKQQLLDAIETENFHFKQDLEKRNEEIAKLKAELKAAKTPEGLGLPKPVRIPVPNAKARQAGRRG